MAKPFSCLKAAARIKTMRYLIALTLAYKMPLMVEFRRFYPGSKLANLKMAVFDDSFSL